MSDTRSLQVDMMRHRDEMVEARKQAEQAEQRVRELEAELEHVSEQVREDQLTGTLNRRGLDDAMQREIARAQRKNSALCVAMLDLDNFKKLNDTYGHQAGDDALVHLSKVVRKTLRPTDTVARFGGEEFVIVFAETDLKQAVEVMRRLQRELTKRFSCTTTSGCSSPSAPAWLHSSPANPRRRYSRAPTRPCTRPSCRARIGL